MNQTTKTEDSIDLKELFFSLIAQWKLITLCIILSLVAALLYLRVTPDTYSVDALVQVEDSKGASAALLGDLSNMIEQKSPAQAEIEILKSRLVLGSVIKDLHLNVQISSTENTLTHRLLSNSDYKTEYNKESVTFKDGLKNFEIRQFEIPNYYLDRTLHLNFDKQTLRLTDPNTEQTILTVPLNQLNQVTGPHGTWKVAIFTKDQFDATYNIAHLSVPAAVNAISSNYSVAERGKLTGVLGLNYQGEDKEHITKVLNAVLATYSA
ncbi:Wzz/FepE/Etk N-terminal domain-containing protein, partial [Acinetobacter oleivorans]|uniref:Wzz/FepE/Etk N-terminal domain-containing protein n=1 Tax=Acinetobacter oleivorans TaxID=1148157 RepID=UPI001EC1DCD1